jgi:hypothetical protein
MNQVKRRWLKIFTAISWAALAILSCGYFSEFGPRAQFYVPRSTNPPRNCATSFIIGRGQVRIFWDNWTSPPQTFTPVPTEIYWQGKFCLPSIPASLWQFRVQPHPFGAAGPWGIVVAFPLWCAIISFLIAPILWLRSRRPEPPGFQVLGLTHDNSILIQPEIQPAPQTPTPPVRSTRHIFVYLCNGIAAVSLLMAIGTAATWASQNSWLPQLNFDFILFNTRQREIHLSSRQTQVIVAIERLQNPPVIGPSFYDRAAVTRFDERFPPPQPSINLLQINVFSHPLYGQLNGNLTWVGTSTDFRFAYWYFVIAFMLFPLYLWAAPVTRWYRRKRATDPSLCLQCGYDLRATPDRCPECGTEVKKPNSLSRQTTEYLNAATKLAAKKKP